MVHRFANFAADKSETATTFSEQSHNTENRCGMRAVEFEKANQGPRQDKVLSEVDLSFGIDKTSYVSPCLIGPTRERHLLGMTPLLDLGLGRPNF